MNLIKDMKIQKRIKIEMIKETNALSYFNNNLKFRIFNRLKGELELNIKLQNYYNKAFLNKKRKYLLPIIFISLKRNWIETFQKIYVITNIINRKKRVKINNIFYRELF